MLNPDIDCWVITPPSDLDQDTIPDNVDNCINIRNVSQTDYDEDRIWDACDTDDDNDTILDIDENEWCKRDADISCGIIEEEIEIIDTEETQDETSVEDIIGEENSGEEEEQTEQEAQQDQTEQQETEETQEEISTQEEQTTEETTSEEEVVETSETPTPEVPETPAPEPISTVSTWWGWGGWGGWSSRKKDACPNGDTSGSFYDKRCSKELVEASQQTWAIQTQIDDTLWEDNVSEDEFFNLLSAPEEGLTQEELEQRLKLNDTSNIQTSTNTSNTTKTSVSSQARKGLTKITRNENASSSQVEYRQEIRKFHALGIINGYQDGSFKPEQGVTRTEFLKILLKTHCHDYSNEDTKDLRYTDVDKNSWQARVIQRSGTLGLINGDRDEQWNPRFRPNDVITKLEAIKIILNMSEIQVDQRLKTNYKDIKIPWHRKYVETAETLWLYDAYLEWQIFNANESVERDTMIDLIDRTIWLYK